MGLGVKIPPQSSDIFFSPGRVVGAAVVAFTVVVETVV